MDVVIFLLAASLLKLICRMVLFASRCFPVPVTVWPAFPDVKVRDGEEIQYGRDVLLVFSCIIFQQVSTRAVSGMLCIVISAPRRLSRIVQCSQQL